MNGNTLFNESIAWKLRFLAAAIENMPHRDRPPTDDEYYGVMCLLHDIADEIDPPEKKDSREAA